MPESKPARSMKIKKGEGCYSETVYPVGGRKNSVKADPVPAVPQQLRPSGGGIRGRGVGIVRQRARPQGRNLG